MNEKSGLLAVDRQALLRRAREAGTLAKRAPAVGLAATEAFGMYDGFDGQPWPNGPPSGVGLRDGLVDLGLLPVVREYVAAQASSQSDMIDIVFLTWIGTDMKVPAVPSGWVDAGFDLGYYESEYSHFSVILNEVIFGIHSVLRGFGRVLNRRLLLQNVDDVREMLHARQELVNRGEDVEEVSEIHIVHIALPPDEC